MTGHPVHDRLNILIARLLDGPFSPVVEEKLCQLLYDDPQAQESYLRQAAMHAMLQWENAAPAVPMGADLPVDLEQGTLDADDLDRMAREFGAPGLSAASENSRLWDLVIADAQRGEAIRPPGRDLPEEAMVSCGPLGRRFPRTARVAGWLLASPARRTGAAAAAAAVVALVLVWFCWQPCHEDWRQAFQVVDDFPARLTQAADCRWDDPAKRPRVGQGLAVGDRLELQAGLAAIDFADGAKVVVRGPARFQVRSAEAGRLERGVLAALVPPRAAGFTIETPTTVIVDRGTEFTAEVREDGTGDIRVFAGRVEVASLVDDREPAGNAPTADRSGATTVRFPQRAKPLELQAGQTVRVDSAGIQPVSRRAVEIEDFRTMSGSLEPGRLLFPPGDHGPSDLAMAGDASAVAATAATAPRLQLTTGAPGRTGSAWCVTKHRVGDGFTMGFLYEISGDPRGDATGRIAAIVSNAASPQSRVIDDCGAGPWGLSVRFYRASVAVIVGGKELARATLPAGRASPRERSWSRFAKIAYVPGRMQVSVDETVVLDEVAVDLEKLPDNSAMDAKRTAWIGFAASTGPTPERHEVLLWRFNGHWLRRDQ